MTALFFVLLLVSVFHGVLCEPNRTELNFSVAQDAEDEVEKAVFLSSIIATHYRGHGGTYVNIRVQNSDFSEATRAQLDFINELIRLLNTDGWMMAVAYRDIPTSEGRAAYYNVFLVQDYGSLCGLVEGMSYDTFQFHGLYTILIRDDLPAASVKAVMQKFSSMWIINVVVIVEGQSGEYVAYTYDPYRAGKCASAEPIELGRYSDGGWSPTVEQWFPERTVNLHGCPLKVGLVEVKPYSMFRREQRANRTVYFGLEVYIAESIASQLNFSIEYMMPRDNVKWGILHTANSSGLVGMIQRREVAFGFGSLGFSLSRHTYLKWSTPSHMTQMIIAIPPKRPYTSLEKLFQPFTINAWLCIGFGYTTFGLVTLLLMNLNINHVREQFANPLYSLWVLLMGGSGANFRLDSWRIFIIGFIINTLIIRTLYQAGMFERLQASATLASDLNTIEAINKAGLYYTMYRSTVQFYKDNPSVPKSHIRIVQNDTKNWDELFYDLSQDRLGGVIALPLDCIAYYVKRNGKRGIVYLGKHTGFMYNIGMHFPKMTPLQESFNRGILQLHAAGLTHYWAEEFRDNRYWTNAKEEPEPASLKWDQISGGFFLCGVMLALTSVVFFGELIYFHLSARGARATARYVE